MGTADALAAVHRYIEAFNDGDMARMASMFDNAGVILDGMAPHVWLGPTAAQDWYSDVLVESAQHGASGYAVVLGEPRHNTITGDRAYLVLPAAMTFRVNGTDVRQEDASFTVALRHLPEGWRIAAWTWTKGDKQ
jgi:hypothetical protein